MVDWGVARRIATGVAGDAGRPTLPGNLDELCTDAAERVVAYTLLTPAAPLPPPEAIGRAEWIDANLNGMRGVMEPLTERMTPSGNGVLGPLAGPLRAAGGSLVAAEVGALVGIMAQRVLGQYEVPPLDPEGPARLLFVAPNLHAAAGKLEVDEASLLRWVALHEVTHAVQFSSVPWLRAHIAGMLRELLESMDLKVDLKSLGRLADGEELKALVARVREGGLMTAMVGPERRAVFDRMQATMAVVEGHAEHVMDATGADVLPDLAELRAALDRRRRDRPPLMRILEKLMGFEMKMKQYVVGRQFCDAVVAARGVEGLNRAFAAPEHLPTWAELEDPPAWLERVFV